MLRIGMLSALVCLFAVSVSYGQEFPQPGPEHKKLQELVGTWDAVMEMNGEKSKSTVVYKSICGGMWVASDFEGDLGGLKYQGHGLDGYDQNKKEYVGIWVDSMSSAPMQLRGNYNKEKDLLVMTGESIGPDGAPQKVKTTTSMKDKDHMTFKFFMADNADQPMFTIEYSRKK